MTKDVARVEIEKRVEEAWDVLRRLPDRERSTLALAVQDWPLVLRQACEHGAWEGVRLRRPPPTARQIDRMHEVLAWMLALAKVEREFARAVWLACALRKKPHEIGKLMGISRWTARLYRDRGLDLMAGTAARASNAA